MNVKCSIAIFLMCAHASQAAVVHRSESTVNTYENLPVENGVDYGNIEDNEIIEERDFVYGLYPPKASSKDYYDSKTSYPKKGDSSNGEYIIDTVNKVLKLKTEEGSHETKLKPIEEVEIKKLSAAFAKIFDNSKLENYDWGSPTQTEPSVTDTSPAVSTEDWKKLSPIITVSKSGVSIAFGNETTPQEPEGSTEVVEEEDPARDSLWDAISKSVDKLLIDELDRRLNMTEEDTTEDLPTEETPVKDEEPSYLGKFISSVWNLMKSSLDYVGALFSNLMFGKDDADQTEVSNTTDIAATTETTEEEEENITALPTTTSAVFAYEEPTRYKRLPAEEFETRRRDIDSLFYGYGIV